MPDCTHDGCNRPATVILHHWPKFAADLRARREANPESNGAEWSRPYCQEHCEGVIAATNDSNRAMLRDAARDLGVQDQTTRIVLETPIAGGFTVEVIP